MLSGYPKIARLAPEVFGGCGVRGAGGPWLAGVSTHEVTHQKAAGSLTRWDQEGRLAQV